MMSVSSKQCLRLVGIVVGGVLLSGCVDEARVRELTQQMLESQARDYSQRVTSEMEKLAKLSPCCDDLSTARPMGKLSADKAFSAAIGVWPNNDVIEVEGFRSYYALIAIEEPFLRAGQMLSLNLFPGVRSFASPVDLSPSREVFAASVMFLDSGRRAIGRAVPTPASSFASNAYSTEVFAPVGTSFVLIYSTRDRFSGKERKSHFSPSAAYFPVGASMVRFQPSPAGVSLLPSMSGSVTLSMQP